MRRPKGSEPPYRPPIKRRVVTVKGSPSRLPVRRPTDARGLWLERNKEGVLFFRQPHGDLGWVTWRVYASGEAILRRHGVTEGQILPTWLYSELKRNDHLFTDGTGPGGVVEPRRKAPQTGWDWAAAVGLDRRIGRSQSAKRDRVLPAIPPPARAPRHIPTPTHSSPAPSAQLPLMQTDASPLAAPVQPTVKGRPDGMAPPQSSAVQADQERTDPWASARAQPVAPDSPRRLPPALPLTGLSPIPTARGGFPPAPTPGGKRSLFPLLLVIVAVLIVLLVAF